MLGRTQPAQIVSILLIVVLTVIVTHQATGNRATQAPSTVGTIDILRVLDGLNERAEADVNFQRMRAEIEAEDEQRQEKLKSLQDQVAEMPAGEELTAMVEELERGMIQLQYWRQIMLEQVDVEQSLLLQDLFQKVIESCGNMATASGIDVVFSDDSKRELYVNTESQLARETQLRQQVLARRIIYVNEQTVDVTDELIQWMNNRWDAGEG